MARKRNPLSILGFLLALFGSLIFWIPFSDWLIVFGVALLALGFIFSIIALIIGASGRSGLGFSITGLLISFICLSITLLFYVPRITFLLNNL